MINYTLPTTMIPSSARIGKKFTSRLETCLGSTLSNNSVQAIKQNGILKYIPRPPAYQTDRRNPASFNNLYISRTSYSLRCNPEASSERPAEISCGPAKRLGEKIIYRP